ncbi:unnamed protein product [Prunus armeniaca]|uniref:Uncharacterized protein n=1 Tax=Prunus armeniaca TaxID=36596 RepID=A0A6J5WL65_PRUAR|nr:unnamed protein product [Prunus armeniaca]
MSQMGVLKPGVTFVLGAMAGAFITRRCHQHHHHDHEGRKPWSCPRQAHDKKIESTSSPGTVETATTATTPNLAN